MNEEKQIEEMASILGNGCKTPCHECRYANDCGEFEGATKLYEAGYRKQSKGEWIVTKTERAWNGAEYPTEYTCSYCGRVQPFAERYCPDCGAKMKGGTK